MANRLLIMRILLVIASFFLIFNFQISGTKAENSTLVLVHALFRHGDKSVDVPEGYPKDPHKGETYYPFGYGQLTTHGKRRAYNIGKYLRHRYDTFLPAQFSPELIYALSSNFRRTKMTLQLVLAALFQPTETDRFEEGLNWQPIAFDYEQEPKLLQMAQIHCVTYMLALQQYIFSPEAEMILAEHRKYYNELSTHTGANIRVPGDVAHIYNIISCQRDYGLKLPTWAEKEYPQKFEQQLFLHYDFLTATTALKKLSAGFLLKKIIDDTEAHINGRLSKQRKIFLYSGHDLNIVTLLKTLNIFHPHVPPYGATLLLEIHKVEGHYGVKIFYRDQSAKEAKLLKIPGCAEFCEINKFTDIVQKYLPDSSTSCSIGSG